MKLLVLSAWEPELAALRSHAAARPDLDGVAFESVGVGLVEAAIGASRGIALLAPTHVLFVGTCGTLLPNIGIGQVVVGADARLIDVASLSGAAEIPDLMPCEVAFDRILHDAACVAGAQSVHIANTASITVDEALAALLAQHADVEHLEAFAFARACAVHGVASGIVLGVANEVGPRGRAQWSEHHVTASARAAEVTARVIDALAGPLGLELPP
ncbi:MAG: hypothetical protein FWD69_03175 [Polyangiaceae bacterium]|nr:hypothetical protein [Polyangiaceae bacterium]